MLQDTQKDLEEACHAMLFISNLNRGCSAASPLSSKQTEDPKDPTRYCLRQAYAAVLFSLEIPAVPLKAPGKEQRAENRMVRTSSSTDGRMLAYLRPQLVPGPASCSGSQQGPQEGLLDDAEAATLPGGHSQLGLEGSTIASMR